MAKGESKRRKVPGLIRVALADNVRFLMDQKYPGHPNKPKALAKDAGIGLYTVQRLLDGSTGANLDTIEAIATVFKVHPHELLTPMFGRDLQAGSARRPGPTQRARPTPSVRVQREQASDS